MNTVDGRIAARHRRLRTGALAAALAGLLGLGACAPILLGGALVGGALVATDRRTSGTQLEDEAIELKARARIGDALGDRGHAITTSYNRVVLITGEVQTAADKALVGQAVERVENVRSVVNELALAGSSSLFGRSNDTIITGKVKTAFLDAKDLMANTIKVVTERGTVYLMGRVTEREATRAADIARGVGGVQKVVRVFEVLTEAELAAMPSSRPVGAPPAAVPTTPPGEAARR